MESDGKSATKTVIRTLFDAGNPYPQKKVLTFNRYNSDFDFSVFYGNLNYLSQEEQRYVRNGEVVTWKGIPSHLSIWIYSIPVSSTMTITLGCSSDMNVLMYKYITLAYKGLK